MKCANIRCHNQLPAFSLTGPVKKGDELVFFVDVQVIQAKGFSRQPVECMRETHKNCQVWSAQKLPLCQACGQEVAACGLYEAVYSLKEEKERKAREQADYQRRQLALSNLLNRRQLVSEEPGYCVVCGGQLPDFATGADPGEVDDQVYFFQWELVNGMRFPPDLHFEGETFRTLYGAKQSGFLCLTCGRLLKEAMSRHIQVFVRTVAEVKKLISDFCDRR